MKPPGPVTTAFNAILRTWAPEGTTAEKKDVFSHHEVLTHTRCLTKASLRRSQSRQERSKQAL
ncbi:hypothetical protein PG991_014072 [Apiospora marii]|uniref:Uncharacterized protein n=1 Tax=Apiospora marii TaxID=335849 RepID=A0ABR1R7S2_9PEZI